MIHVFSYTHPEWNTCIVKVWYMYSYTVVQMKNMYCYSMIHVFSYTRPEWNTCIVKVWYTCIIIRRSTWKHVLLRSTLGDKFFANYIPSDSVVVLYLLTISYDPICHFVGVFSKHCFQNHVIHHFLTCLLNVFANMFNTLQTKSNF